MIRNFFLSVWTGILSFIAGVLDPEAKWKHYLRTKLMVRRNIFYAILLFILFLFRQPLTEIFNQKIVDGYFRFAKSSVLTDAVMYLVFLFTILYFSFLPAEKRKVNNEYLIFTGQFAAIYFLARISGNYQFLSFSHTGLSSLYYADWLLLFFFHLLFLKTESLRIKKGNPVYERQPFIFDTPITDNKDDLFGRKKFAEQIALKIMSKTPDRGSIAIGINGPWGSGKTSFLNMVLHHIDKNNRIIIRFEPWKCKSTAEIIREFFDLLIKEMSAENKQLSFSLQEYADKLVELDKNIYTQTIKSITSFVSPGPKAKGALYDEINNKIAVINKQIIIVIDDLDRLDKAEVIEVIRLIRNTADFDGISFLACYDKGYVLSAVKELNEYNHKHYLEKIFQYEFVLPVFDFDILKQQLEKLAEPVLDDIHKKEFSRILYRTIEEGADLKPLFLKTQRDVIRFANSFFFEFKNLEGEVDMEDLFYIHLLKLKYQRIYELLTERKELFFVPKKFLMGDDILRLRLTSSLDKKMIYFTKETAQPSSAEDRYVFSEYFNNNRDLLQLTQADIDLLENFMDSLFNDGARYRDRFRSTNEIIYAQSFDKYFAYNLLKSNLSTNEFNHARTNVAEYYTYLQNKVKAGLAGPVMDKLFLVKEFSSADDMAVHVQGLCRFGNLIRKQPLFDVYHDNYQRYTDELLANSTIPLLPEIVQFLKKDVILMPGTNVPFFEYNYLTRHKGSVFTEEEFKMFCQSTVKAILFAFTNKNTPALPPELTDAYELVSLISKLGNTEFVNAEIEIKSRLYDFWNFNDPSDFGILIKKDASQQEERFTIDTNSPLFTIITQNNDTPENMTPAVILNNLNHYFNSVLIRERNQAFADSPCIKEFLSFLQRLQQNNNTPIAFTFVYLKPGEMQADHSAFEWKLEYPVEDFSKPLPDN